MSMTPEQFVAATAASGVLSADELRELVGRIPAERRQQVNDLAKEFIKAGKLTKYQASAIYQAKGDALVFGDYVVLDIIGAGGMGKVYKAQHRRMKRIVALKLLPPEATKSQSSVKRFYQEVEMAARLTHPNVVTAYDAGEAGGQHYMAMEFVDGQDLSSVVKKHGALPVDRAVNYIIQAARGLEYAHRQGLIHRDIKPANLLLDREGVVKILDMGLARVTNTLAGADNAASEGLTQSGQIMGTVDYMAPEQAQDTRSADQRADIYSLGCTFYRLLTGQTPFGGDTLVTKILAHREQQAPSLLQVRPETPPVVDAVYRKMMAKRPENRFQSMTEVIAALEGYGAATSADGAALVTEGESSGDEGLNSFLRGVSSSGVGTAKKAVAVAAEATLKSQHDRDTDSRSNVVAAAPRNKLVLPLAIGGGVVALLAIAMGIFFATRAPEPQVVDIPGEVNPAPTPKPAPIQPAPQPTPSPNETPQPVVPDNSPTSAVESPRKPPEPAMPAPTMPDKTPPPDAALPVVTTPPAMPAPTPAPTPSAPQPTPTPTPAPAPALTPSVDTPSAVVASDQPVNLLLRIDPDRDAVAGKWRFEEHALLVPPDASGDNPRLQIPVVAPAEYRLQAVVERVAGEGFLCIGLVFQGKPFYAIIDYEGQTSLSVNGAFRDNPSSAKLRLMPIGRRVTLSFTLRESGIRMHADGRLLIDWDSYKFLQPMGGWEVKDLSAFAIAGQTGTFRISELELTPLAKGWPSDPGLQPAPSRPRLPVPATDARLEAAKALAVDMQAGRSAGNDAAMKGISARKLLRKAIETTDKPAVRYVLMEEARALAISAVDMPLALAAAQELARAFDVDEREIVPKTLAELSTAAKTPAVRDALRDQAMRVQSDAISAAQFALADELQAAITPLAQKGRNPEVLKEVNARKNELLEWKKQWLAAAEAAEELQTKPEDGDANLAVGRYLCLARNDWQAGLPYLSKGSDAGLKLAAAKDLLNPTKPDDQAAVGSAWQDAVDKTPMPVKALFLARAERWFRQAVPKLTGPVQSRTNTRLQKLADLRKPLGSAFGPRHPLDALPFGGHAYKYFPGSFTWDEAQQLCEEMGGDLACIESEAENRVVEQYGLAQPLVNKDTIVWWLGAKVSPLQTDVRWLTGAPAEFSDWYPGYPSAVDRETYLCGHREAAGSSNIMWINYDVSQRAAFICEWAR